MSSPFEIPGSVLDRMVERAEADYPSETCGLAFTGVGGMEVVPLPNIQDDLHRRDPEAHPRDSRTAYAFDAGMLVRAIAEREAAGKSLTVIYHSHPDHDAYFSATDRREAAPPEWGEPTYPGAVYLVLSVREGKFRRAAAFAWSEEAKDFVEREVMRLPV
jgi:proteasome lid subunit RPN8/RPN11